ncbi:MAG TPA: hypothetical protein VIV40_35170 [Kofleriaceae bacterium]
MIEDLADRYHEYLERWTREAGDVPVGTFAKFSGKLVKKLSFEEFTPILVEYAEMATRYQESVDRGDTINDVVLKVLRDQAAQLMLPAPG